MRGGSNVLIDGGTGNDSILNADSSDVTINGGDDDDIIRNGWDTDFNFYIHGGDSVSIDGGAGNDSIYNKYGDSVTISGGTGNDSIYNSSESVSINAGDGNDSIKSYGTNSTIDAGAGNDSIVASGDNSTIDAGAGDDSIFARGANSTINSGLGNDIVTLASNNLIEYAAGDGNDTVYRFNESDTITITGASYFTQTSGSDVIVTVGEGKIILKDVKGKSLHINKTGSTKFVTLTDNDDEFNGNLSDVTINAGAGNDSIYNYGDSVTINAGDGDDYISAGDNSTIDGGAGNDYINAGSNSTIDAGAGDDSICNECGENVLINAGDGNDEIYSGGAGDDQISLGSDDYDTTENTLIEYAAGDGNDVIEGFNETSTLQIGDGTGTYSKATVGNDIIITVGDGSVLLKDAASLSSVNIDGDLRTYTPETPETKLITLTEGADNYSTSVEGATIQALGGNDSIQNYGASVLIDGGDDMDSITNSGSNVSIDGGDGDDTIYNDGDNVTINAGGGDDTIYNDGSNVIIKGGAGDDYIYNYGLNVIINSGAGDDTITLGSYANNLIGYTAGDGNDLIFGFDDNDTLQIGGGTGTYSTTTSGNNLFVCVGNDTLTMVNAATLTDNIVGDLKTYTPATPATKLVTLTEGADNCRTSVEGATVRALGGGDNLFNAFINVSIDAGTGNDTIQNYGSNTTLNAGTGDDSIYNDSDNVTISGGGGNDSIDNNGKKVSIDAGDGSDSITTNDYSNNVMINAGAGNDDISNYGLDNIVNGGKGDDSVYSNRGVEYIFTYALGDGNDSLSEGAIVNLVDGATISESLTSGKDAILKFADGGTVTINNAVSGDGFIGFKVVQNNNYQQYLGFETINNTDNAKLINVTARKATIQNDGNDATITGGAGNDTITNNGTDVSIDAGTGDEDISNYGSNVTISGGAGNDSLWNMSDSVTMDGGTGDDWLFYGANYYGSIDGGTGDDEIESNGQFVTINGGAGNDVVSLSSDAVNNLIAYKVGDGNDTVYGFDGNDTLKISGGIYSTQKSGTDIIVTVDDNSITLKDAAKLSAAKIHISGAILPAGLSINNGKLEVSSSFKGKEVDATDLPVEIIDASNFKSKIEIVGNAADNTITGGKGNDTLTGGGTNTFAMSGGKDIVTDYVAGVDKILVDGTPSVTVNNKNGDTVVQVGKNSLTLKKLDGEDVSAGKVLTFTDDTNDTTRTYFSDKIVDGDSVTLQPAFKGTFDGADFAKVDASNAKVGVKIIGGTSILGSSKNDTLLAKNSTLTGDKGSDVFIAESSATITDYETSDKISLGADIFDVAIDGGNVVLTFGGNSLTIQDAADKKVTLLDGKKSTAYIFDNHAIFDGSKKAGTLTAGDEFNAANYSALVTIDASQASNATITGNSKANKVSLGKDNVFIWAGGNDTLTNFTADDKLSITGTVTDGTVTKGNSVLNVGKNKITVKDSAQVIFKDDGGTKIFSAGIFTDADETSATLPASFSQQNTKTPLPLDYATIDASNVKKALNLSLGDGNDSIHGGKKGDSIHGGDGNDTLTGGAGNDSLWGDNGADTFIYSKGDGKDVIFGFDDADMLEIIGLGDNVTGTLNKAGTELAVKVGKTAVAVLKDFTATTFNINGETYQLSGKALVKA